MKDWLHELIPSVSIPEGKLESAQITHFEISDAQAARYNLGLMMNRQGHRAVTAGQYTRLVANGQLANDGHASRKTGSQRGRAASARPLSGHGAGHRHGGASDGVEAGRHRSRGDRNQSGCN